MEGVPGLGKTLLVRTLARCLGVNYSRIQFTPDLMPSDIIGTNIIVELSDGTKRFEFHKGPLFTNLLLADEINRTTPKTQSALLEAMQERAVTAFGKRYELESPFFVMATENPIEMEGTYPLPEAQLDRFIMKLFLSRPSVTELESIIDKRDPQPELAASKVLERSDLLELQNTARQILIPEAVRNYASRLIDATHPDSADAPDLVKKYVKFGSSPRGAQALVACAKVNALIEGRPNVGFDDIRAVANPCLRHRVLLSFEAAPDNVTADKIVNTLLESVMKTSKKVEEAARK